MKTQSRLMVIVPVAAAALALLATPVGAVDLLERYPTSLTTGDSEPSHARPWEFSPGDIYRVSQFDLEIGDQLKVKTGVADLGIGHCADGAVWAVLIPREHGTLNSPVTSHDESVANVWLRFHPAQIDHLFPPATVFADGDRSLEGQMRDVAGAKFRSSWHAGKNAMIPEPKDLTVYVDTKDGSHRFFVVDTQAQTAEYVAAFDRRSRQASRIFSLATAPPVVVKTVPESGALDVAPGATDIRVTFSKEMTDGSWSWCNVWDGSTPEGLEPPRYEADHKTCVARVKLEPNRTYGYWLNTEQFTHFRDAQGHPAVPYLLVFRTGGGEGNASAGAEEEGPPMIVATSPQIGATDVDPGITEITVTFDRDMAGGFSWTGGGPDYPPSPEGQSAHWRDQRTCVLPVQLQPAHYYRVGINSKSFQNFCSAAGVPALPSAIYFATKGASEEVKQMVVRPEIVSLIPANGKQDVDPNLTEIRATFNVPMSGGFSWTGGDTGFPPGREGQQVHWTEDHRTCVLPVRLQPGHTYRLGLNSPSHKNFQSEGGVPLDPVQYTFSTRGK